MFKQFFFFLGMVSTFILQINYISEKLNKGQTIHVNSLFDGIYQIYYSRRGRRKLSYNFLFFESEQKLLLFFSLENKTVIEHTNYNYSGSSVILFLFYFNGIIRVKIKYDKFL